MNHPTPSQILNAEIERLMVDRRCDRPEATAICRQLMKNLANAADRDHAMTTDLHNITTATMPEHVSMSADGQKLRTAWPVAPSVLADLGLPQNATEEQFNLYVLAEKTPLTPESAALLVVEMTRGLQIGKGLTFDDAMKYIKDERPELYKMAQQATIANSFDPSAGVGIQTQLGRESARVASNGPVQKPTPNPPRPPNSPDISGTLFREAAEKFQKEVRKIQEEQQISYDAAFASAQRQFPALWKLCVGPKAAAVPNTAAKRRTASDDFLTEVNNCMRDTGCDYDAAFARCTATHRDLYNSLTTG